MLEALLYRGTHTFCLVNYYFGLRYSKKRSASRPWDPSGSWIFGAGGHRRAAHAVTGLSGLRGLVEGRALPDIVVLEGEVLSSWFWSLACGLFLSRSPHPLHVGESTRDFTIRAFIKKDQARNEWKCRSGNTCLLTVQLLLSSSSFVLVKLD